MKLKATNYLFLLLIIFSFSCKKEVAKVDKKTQPQSTIKYAKGFDIVDENGIKKLVIKAAYKNSKEVFNYEIIKKNSKSEINTSSENIISTPVNKIVVTSTTHIPMVELLNKETAIVGFPYAKYVSSEKTRTLIDEGKITEIYNQNL